MASKLVVTVQETNFEAMVDSSMLTSNEFVVGKETAN